MLSKLKNLLRKSEPPPDWQAGARYSYTVPLAARAVSGTIVACVNAIISKATVPEFRAYAGGQVHSKATELLERPDGVLTWRDWYASILARMLLAGNGYAILRKVGSRPFWVIVPPDYVTPLVDQEGRLVGYEILHGGVRLRLPEAEVLHLSFGYPSETPGVAASPLDLLRDYVGGEQALSEYVNAMLRNFGAPTVVYTYKGGGVLSEEQWRAIDTYFRENFAGNRRGSVAVLRLPFDVTTLGGIPDSGVESYLHLLEARVCSIYRVPAQVAGAVVGYKYSTYSNYEHALQSFIDHTIVPIITQTEWQLYKVLRGVHPDVTEVKADLTQLMPQPTWRERIAVAGTLAELYMLGIVTREEVREVLGLPAEPIAPEDKQLPAGVDWTAPVLKEDQLAAYWKLWDTLNREAAYSVLRVIRSTLNEYRERLEQMLGAEKAAFSPQQLLQEFVDQATQRVVEAARRFMERAASLSLDVVSVLLRRPVPHATDLALRSAVEEVNRKARVSFANFATEVADILWTRWGQVTVPELIKEIRARFRGYAATRARACAQTSVTAGITRAQSTVWRIAGQEAGTKIVRVWVSMRDERVRDSHRAMDGKTEDPDGLFTLPSGLRGEGPGLFDDPAESVNCRCTLRPRRL